MFKIYKITNNSNGKVYIGKTIWAVERRWKMHIWYALRGSDLYLSNAIRKHGVESFDRKTIDYAESEDEINVLEKLYIGIFQSYRPENGYNLTHGGDGTIPNEATIQRMKERAPWKNKKMPLEIRQKMSASRKGIKFSNEHKQRIGNAHRGKIVSEETREKLRQANLGKKASEESKKKMSRPGSLNPMFGVPSPMKGKPVSIETRDKISKALKGRVFTDEQKSKISESLKSYFRNKPPVASADYEAGERNV
jgi:group I intron endonuclease